MKLSWKSFCKAINVNALHNALKKVEKWNYYKKNVRTELIFIEEFVNSEKNSTFAMCFS